MISFHKNVEKSSLGGESQEPTTNIVIITTNMIEIENKTNPLPTQQHATQETTSERDSNVAAKGGLCGAGSERRT